MTTLTLNISDTSILPSLKKILGAINGVSIVSTTRKKTELEKAREDVNTGRLLSYSSKEELFKDLGILWHTISKSLRISRRMWLCANDEGINYYLLCYLQVLILIFLARIRNNLLNSIDLALIHTYCKVIVKGGKVQ